MEQEPSIVQEIQDLIDHLELQQEIIKKQDSNQSKSKVKMNLISLDHNKVINQLSDSNLCQVLDKTVQEKPIVSENDKKEQGWDEEIEIDLDDMQFED